MRHRKKGRKLGTDAAHTKAMKKSLTQALFLNDRIKTIESRAKEIRPDVDRIITWAKRGDLHSRRLAIAKLGDKELVREVFAKVEQGMWADRPGGYTRIIKLGPRKGDNAPMVIMELVTEPVAKKAAQAEPSTKKTAPKKLSKATEEKAEEVSEEKAVEVPEEKETEADSAGEADIEEAVSEAPVEDTEAASEGAAEDSAKEAHEQAVEEKKAE